MTHKAQAHANEHTEQHEIGKVPHVPDISCQVTNQHQFQEKHQEGYKGRSFQLGEGWHSNANAVRLWNSSPRIPKETHYRCYASATAYAMMIPPCNSCSGRSKRPTHSRR